MKTKRTHTLLRKTKETDIKVFVNLDGNGNSSVNTGVGFLDHLLTSFSKHSLIDIEITCKGDLEVDDHHSVEDSALSLGTAIKEALGDKRGINRFGYSYAPLDESLVRAVIDLSGRAYSVVQLKLERESIGDISTENIEHFISSFSSTLLASIHVHTICGSNCHHKAEAAFKALALAIKEAISLKNPNNEIPSTKGVL